MSEENKKDNRTRLTTDEKVTIRRIGDSTYVCVPKIWSKLQALQNKLAPFTELDTHIETDDNGIIYLIFKRRNKKCQPM